MTSTSYSVSESADGPALLRPPRQQVQGEVEEGHQRNRLSCYGCFCCRRSWCGQALDRAFFRIMARPKVFRQLFYFLNLLAFIGWISFVCGFTFRRERDTDDASIHFTRSLIAWWLVSIEGGLFFAALLLTVFVYNLITMATSIFLMLIYLICVGAVLQGDGSWLYDHWGRGSDLHSAVVIEMSGLIFSIIFSVPSTTILFTVGLHFANRREHELTRYNFVTL